MPPTSLVFPALARLGRGLGRALRIARGASLDAVRVRVADSVLDLIAELISLARKKVGDSQTKTKKSVTVEVK